MTFKKYLVCFFLGGLMTSCILASADPDAAPPVPEKETIIMATFNIQKLGERPDTARLERLADICRGVDFLAIQEVYETGNGVEALAVIMGPEYHYAVSEVTLHERFGFIWRAPVTLLEPPGFAPDLPLGRHPFLGKFKAGNFDFQAMTVHLFWDGSKKTYPHTRGVELKLLDDWLCHRTDKELDLIILGDFNEPNMYHGYQFAPPQSFHEDFYTLINRHNMISVSLNHQTPTSIVNRNIYDHLIFNPSHYFVEEFAGMDRVRVVKWETRYDANDNNYLEYKEYETAKKEISDHRPVFAEFFINMPDDDEVE